MSHAKWIGILTMVLGLNLGRPVYSLEVGWSVDLHQNQFIPCADDFHVWGVIESMPDQNGPHPPVLLGQDNLEPYDHYMGQNCYSGIFDHFTYQIGGPANPNLPKPIAYQGPWPPVAPPWYYFEATWWSDENCVEFCHWAHFGLKFDVSDANSGYWLQGRWTAEHGAQYAQSNIPMVGFQVVDGPGAYLRIQNANPFGMSVLGLDMTTLPIGTTLDINNLTNNYFSAHPEMVWTPVPPALLPTYIAPSSFFDVFLESVSPLPGGSGIVPAAGQILLVRQHLSYVTSGGGTEDFWQYELHQAIIPSNPQTTVHGTVMLNDFVGDATAVSIDISIRMVGSPVPVEVHPVTLASDGQYSFTTTLTGTYDVAAKGPHWLRQLRSAVPLTGTAPVNFSLLNGDCDGSNIINAADLALVLAAMDSVPASPQADLDGDGAVTSTDLSINLKSMNLAGAVEVLSVP